MTDRRERAKEYAPVVVSTLVMGGFILVCSLLFVKIIPTESQQIAQVLFGGLVAMATTVVNYWMGSSSGSVKKDETIANMRDERLEKERREREDQIRVDAAGKLQDTGKVIEVVTANSTNTSTVTTTTDVNNLLGGR